MRLIVKKNAHLSTVSEEQLQTVVVAVSVVQFHMTTRLNFMLVNLSTSKTSKYLQKKFWNKHRRQCYFWYMSWFNLPLHHQVSKLLPPRHCWDSRFRKKNLQWIQLSERRQNTSPLSIRTLIGREKTFCTARVTQPILFWILPKIGFWDSIAL